jgi:Tol biopolymer transport system component
MKEVTMRLVFVAALLAALAASAFALGNNHAVMIQGFLPAEGLPGVSSADELWNDCFLWYELMYHRPSIGGDSGRRHMFWCKGADYGRTGSRYDPARLGLYHITDDSADLPHISACFESLATVMDSTDTMFCYTWGHGGSNYDKDTQPVATHFNIQVRPTWYHNGGWHGTPLWDTVLRRMTDPIPSQRVFIMQQCNGGGFIDDLNDERTTMICAAAAGYVAKSCDNRYNFRWPSPLPERETTGTQRDSVWRHCEFNFHFMNALRGRAVWSFDSGYVHPETVYADTSGDSIVSWYEAFRYDQKYNSTDKFPVYCNPPPYACRMEPIPGGTSMKPVSRGAALAATEPDSCDSIGASLWVLKGNNTLEFWKYDVSCDTWIQRQGITWLGHKPKDGATLTAGVGGKLYATKGGNTHEFWKYDTATDAWTQGQDVPGRKVGKGASATFAMVDNVPYIYLLKATSTLQFCRFNIPAATWETLAWAPAGPSGRPFKDGSCIAFDGDTTIYALKGRFNEFYTYSTCSGTWTARCSLPFVGDSGKKVKAGYGAALASCGDWIFAMKGSNSREMWAYDTRSNSWLQAQDVPLVYSGRTVRYGGSLAQAGGLVWILKGNRSDDFYRFAPNRCYVSAPPQPASSPPGPNELLLAVDGDAEDVRWSNSGLWVAFTAPDSSGHRQVFKVPASGGQTTRLTLLCGDCARPVWSPGDTSLAFEVTLDDSDFSQIAAVRATGGQVTFLTSSHWDHWHATWSQAGTVGFLRDDSTGFPQVYVKVSTGEAAFTQQSVEHESPEFVTPTQIVFTGAGGNGYTQVYQTTASAPNATALTSSTVDHANPVPAPGAGLVFFEVDGPGGFTQIAKAPVGGGPEVVLTSGSYDFESPTVNNSASVIYCTRSSGPGSSICQVSPTGGYVQLTDEDVERVTPHAQPNGLMSMSAAYVRDSDVFRLTAGGGGQQSAGLFSLALAGAEPNPAANGVKIRWQVPVETDISLRVYNTAGQLVKVLVDGRTKPGAYTIVWSGTDARGRQLAAGIYFYTLDDGEQRITRKVVLTE